MDSKIFPDTKKNIVSSYKCDCIINAIKKIVCGIDADIRSIGVYHKSQDAFGAEMDLGFVEATCLERWAQQKWFGPIILINVCQNKEKRSLTKMWSYLL